MLSLKWRAPKALAAVHSSITRVALFLGVALGLWAPDSAQGAQVSPISVDTVDGELRSYFPDALSRGWAPVQVSLTNRGNKRRDVTINLESDYGHAMARSAQEVSLDLGPGEAQEIELYVPCDRDGGGQSYSFRMSTAGDRSYFHVGLCGEDMPPSGRVICLVRGGPIGDGEKATALAALPNATPSVIRGVGNGLSWSTNAWSARPSGGAQGAILFRLEPSQFPGRSMGWSGVDTMICDTALGLERSRKWKHVADWVRSGGQIVFTGPDAASVAQSLPGVKELLDERFRVASGGDGAVLYQAGFGLVSLHELEGLPQVGEAWVRVLEPLDMALPKGIDEPIRDPNPSVLGSMYRDIEPWATPMEKKALPVRLVLGFLMLFALLIGPANVWYTRKKKRPDLMFLLVPGLSILASVLLLAYGIGREGFSIKGNAHSLALLDQREDGLTTTVLRRELFAGRGGYALEPKPGTTVMVQDQGSDNVLRRITDDGASMRLGGAFLPAREQSEHLITRVAPARVRVEVKPLAGGGLEVANGLGVDIESLELQTPDGRWMKSTGPIASGATQALQDSSGPELGDELRKTRDPMFAAASAPAGGYLAVVSSSPTADDCGVPMKEISSRHAVVGILSNDAKEWTR